jgi:hypothetical protein
MHRLIGTTFLAVLLLVAFGSTTARGDDSPQKFGVELRGGVSMYDMGDIGAGLNTMKKNLIGAHASNVTLNSSTSSLLGTNGDGVNDNGATGGISFLYRPSKHTMWEVGYNNMFDVNNTVNSSPDTSSGQLLMHASEYFLKGHVVATLMERLQADFGAGISYYSSGLQLQDNLRRRYYYDVKGRAFGVVGSVGLEFLLTKRVGLSLQAGGRLANTTDFVYEDTPGHGTNFAVYEGSRPMEVNLSGGYVNLGLRLYFDQVTKPVDFSR